MFTFCFLILHSAKEINVEDILSVLPSDSFPNNSVGRLQDPLYDTYRPAQKADHVSPTKLPTSAVQLLLHS